MSEKLTSQIRRIVGMVADVMVKDMNIEWSKRESILTEIKNRQIDRLRENINKISDELSFNPFKIMKYKKRLKEL